MPKIDFSFSGWIRGAEINKVTAVDSTGDRRTLDVTDADPAEVAKKLASGEYLISLGDYLYEDNRESEIEIDDFEVSHD